MEAWYEQEGLELRAEPGGAVMFQKEQWLDSEGVSGQVQSLGRLIPQCKRIHAIEGCKAGFWSESGQQSEHYFGV